MDEKATTPYPERTEDVILLVCEPTAEYGKPIVYQGTTITNALKDYYSFSTNREKVDVLKWIVAQSDFAEMQRFSTTENKIFTLYENQYDEILKIGEIPNNLQIAQKFVANGYDVFLLPNPMHSTSADFIVRKKSFLFYVEAKTLNGKNSLDHRLHKGSKQSEHIAVNIIGTHDVDYIARTIKSAFERNCELKNVIIFKGSRLIKTTAVDVQKNDYPKFFRRIWIQNK